MPYSGRTSTLRDLNAVKGTADVRADLGCRKGGGHTLDRSALKGATYCAAHLDKKKSDTTPLPGGTFRSSRLQYTPYS